MILIQDNVSLLPYNTFKIRKSARHFSRITSVHDFSELQKSSLFKNQPRLFLGGGSNILLTKDFPGLVIKNELKGINMVAETDDTITLNVGSGESWHDLVLYAVRNNYGGIENLSLIPGTVGAAPMQNIGAYGAEVKNVIDLVHAINLSTGEARVFNKEECKFGYRESIFKNEARDQYFISSVTLTLSKKNHVFNVSYGAIQETLAEAGVKEPSVKAISDAVIHIRRSKLPDPAVIGNAGSFFKNPSISVDDFSQLKTKFPNLPGYNEPDNMVKVPAGWLIEQCGWKGKKMNDIGVHAKQALVLVNYGNGDGENIWNLAMQIQSSVKEQFNILLHPEVNII